METLEHPEDLPRRKSRLSPEDSLRWRYSSRKTPCPICGRDIDGKCRWRETTINCWRGDRFGPPAHLRPGGTIEALGRTWFLSREDGGIANNSAIFHLHNEKKLSRQPLGRVQRLRHRKQQQDDYQAAQAAFATAKAAFHFLQGIRLIESDEPDEASKALTTVEHALQSIETAKTLLRAQAGSSEEARRQLAALGLWGKTSVYQAHDIRGLHDRIIRHHLGWPTAREAMAPRSAAAIAEEVAA